MADQCFDRQSGKWLITTTYKLKQIHSPCKLRIIKPYCLSPIMSSLAYLHQTNILYSKISTRYNADPEEFEEEVSEGIFTSIQNFIAPATKQILTLFLPYKGYKRTFILRQYRQQQARLKSYTRSLLSRIRQVI